MPNLSRIDFAYHEGLAQRVLTEIRECEDALIQQQDQQSKRDQLYAPARADLEQRFRVGSTATLQTPPQDWRENPPDPEQLITAANAPGDPLDESVFVAPPKIEEF